VKFQRTGRGKYLLPIKGAREGDYLGSKGLNLLKLQRYGFDIPKTFVVTTGAYNDQLDSREEVLSFLRDDLERFIDLDKAYAVRSSANVEDRPGRSFAGQFETKLDVSGTNDLLEAIGDVWDSSISSTVADYSRTMDSDELVEMAVLVQEYIRPAYSGVSFSRNPVTGLNESVIEAVEGSGENLVQRGKTPFRWVNRAGHFVIEPEESPIDISVLESISQGTREMEAKQGYPIDAEWVFDGRDLHWVQMREITAFRSVNIYSNRISKEFLPGIIKPLVWSVNIPLINGAWVRLFTELIGPNDIDPLTLAKSFYYRAYFNMGAIGKIFQLMGFPRDSIEMLMGFEDTGRPVFKPNARTIRLMPRWITVGLDKMTFSSRIDVMFPFLQDSFKRIVSKDPKSMTEKELMVTIEELHEVNKEMAYLNVVTPLLANLYAQMLKRQLKKREVSFEELDLTTGIKDIHLYDPAIRLSSMGAIYHDLSPELRQAIEEEGYSVLEKNESCHLLNEEISSFLNDFGHFSESGNDFSYVPWRENPELVLKMVIQYSEAEEKMERRRSLKELMKKRPSTMLRWTYGRAKQFMFQRDRVSSLFTYGYGLFRPLFMELGARLIKRGILAEPFDIFYLTWEEVMEVVGSRGSLKDPQSLVDNRRSEIESLGSIELPGIIFGDDPPPIIEREVGKLKGTPTSGGYYEGPVRVIGSINEFSKARNGDVLVIPFSDVAWTPLFSKAGAIVAESGGFLSHSSIIAREYGIPAVVSVLGAMELEDETQVTVDGYNGLVSIH
jgi:phosphohistidine swiveling domain-containing protein